MASHSHATHGNAAAWWPGYIRRRSRAYGLDPRAVLAVSSREGLHGGVGDAGTSFGPFQLHVGGALPRGKNRSWAESKAGIDYALRSMANAGASGLTGRAAINAIVTKFERPARSHIGPEIAGAWDFYSSGQRFPGGGAHSPTGTSNDATGGLRPIGAGTNDQTVSFLLQRAREHAAGETPTGSLLDLMMQRQSLQAADQTFGDKTGGTGGTASPDYSAIGGPGITYSDQHLTHQTDGLAGYPAVDLFAKPGTPFRAPEDGRVVRLSGRGGTSGNVFGYSVYFQGVSGKEYFITHLAPNRRPVGTRLRKGQRIGRVSPWTGGATHAHVGVHG